MSVTSVGDKTTSSRSLAATSSRQTDTLSVQRLWHISYRYAVKLVNLRSCRAAVFASHLATRPRWWSLPVAACAVAAAWAQCDTLAISMIMDYYSSGKAHIYVACLLLSYASCRIHGLRHLRSADRGPTWTFPVSDWPHTGHAHSRTLANHLELTSY